MTGGGSASPWSVLRSRRPQTRLETSCTRTGRPRRRLLEHEDSRPAGEGDSHTARTHVAEESDSGIVPMNHSNKDGKTLVESEEGRPLIKEDTHQSGTHPTQSGARVSQGLAGGGGAGGGGEGRKITAVRPHPTGEIVMGRIFAI